MMIVFTTSPNITEAEVLAEKIVTAGLAACVQILPQMTSVYKWQGEVQTESEYLLLIKTLEERFDELSAFITANHRYAVPEIVAVKADRVSEPYLAWITEAVSSI